MIRIPASEYEAVMNETLVYQLLDSIEITDHLGGLSYHKKNYLLNKLFNHYKFKKVYWDNVIDDDLKQNYPNLSFKVSSLLLSRLEKLYSDDEYEPQGFDNFICSFNGSQHHGRILLVSALNNFGYFNPATCTKNFKFEPEVIMGIISNCSSDKYLNFFTTSDTNFSEKIVSINYKRFDHNDNIKTLSGIIKNSFVHVVSETLATSGYPYITEKFLYSVVNNGLFVTYGPPNWHKHLRDFYGFKLYDNIFDYSFDAEPNPVYRVVAMLSMLSKFQNLSVEQRRNLYQLEEENIAYNYNHYQSGNFKECLVKYV